MFIVAEYASLKDCFENVYSADTDQTPQNVDVASDRIFTVC